MILQLQGSNQKTSFYRLKNLLLETIGFTPQVLVFWWVVDFPPLKTETIRISTRPASRIRLQRQVSTQQSLLCLDEFVLHVPEALAIAGQGWSYELQSACVWKNTKGTHLSKWICVCMCACMHVCRYACMHARTDGCIDVWMYGCMDVWMYGWMDGWMYGWMDGCMEVCVEHDYIMRSGSGVMSARNPRCGTAIWCFVAARSFRIVS